MATYYFELIEEGGTVYVIQRNEFSIEFLDVSNLPFLSGSNTFTGTNTFESSVAFSIVSTSSDLMLTDTHHTVLVDASGGSITITLPSASGINGRVYIVKKIDSSSNAVVVQAQTGQTIDGMSSVSLTNRFATIAVQAYGGNWYIIGYYGNA